MGEICDLSGQIFERLTPIRMVGFRWAGSKPKELAAVFGVTHSQIRRIRSSKAWNQVGTID